MSVLNRRAILASALPAMSIPTIAATTQIAQGPAGSKSTPGPMGPPGPPGRRGGAFSAGAEAKNVMDYGAKGNGIDNDRAAIMAAINDARGSSPGLIRFPIGTYKISAPIQLDPKQSGVTFRGDAVSGGGYGRVGSGSWLSPAFSNDYAFKGAGGVLNATWEFLGFTGWGGIRIDNGRALNVRNCVFVCHRGMIFPELWGGVVENIDFGSGSMRPGNVGLFAWPDGLSINMVQANGYDKVIVLSGNGATITNFRIEVSNYGIVLGEDEDGSKSFSNNVVINSGTMEANDRAIYIRNAQGAVVGPLLIQGHEHPGFGSDEMCEGGIFVENASHTEFRGIVAGGGFANAALVDLQGVQWNNKYARCQFNNALTARDNVPIGATRIRLARGRMTSLPRWLKVGLRVDAGGTAANTHVAALGPDYIDLDKPTVAPIAGMFLDSASQVMTGRSSVSFFDSRNIQVGGVYMSNPAANLVEQSTPLNVV